MSGWGRALPLALMAALGVSRPARALPPDTWVLAIGNNQGDRDEIELLYAEDDAHAMADVLRALGGVRPERVLTVLGQDADGVRRALAGVERQVASGSGAGPSALVVYYSGHADATALHLAGSRLPLAEVLDHVDASTARTRLLILDACRSGGASRVKGVSATPSFDLAMIEQAAVEGLAVITSSTAREASLESDRLRGSFFTHFFVGGLRGAADVDDDGQVTLAEVYAYAYAETVRASGRTTSLQHPTFSLDMKGKGEVVLSRLTADAHLGLVELPDEALYLIADGADGRLVAEVHPPRAGARVALPARRYHIQARLAAEYREYDVALRSGETVTLAGRPHRTVAYERLVRRRGGERRYVHGVGLLGGARTPLLAGEAAAPSVGLSYGLDFPWLSVGVRARGGWVASTGADLRRTRQVLAAGLSLERFVDLSGVSVSFGLLVEGERHAQRFETARDAPDATAWAATFSGLLGLEVGLGGGLNLRLEGGPATSLVPVTAVDDGGPTGEALDALLVGWANLGVVWRL